MDSNKKKIAEVAYGSRGYYLGLDFLLKNYFDNTHLMACYEGCSFLNLARCIMFDRTGKVFELNDYLAKPKRFILFSDGTISGVMVTASMPEFHAEIEYEDYAVIVADESSYGYFLDRLSLAAKAEIITFTSAQKQAVREKFCIREIHFWTVLECRRGNAHKKTPKIRVLDGSDLKMVKGLVEKLPEDSSPFRLLSFQLQGMSCKNYSLSFGDRGEVFAGVSPYCSGVYQLSYLTGLSVHQDVLRLAIATLASFFETEKTRLIWRLRRAEVLKNESLVRDSSVVEISQEQHLHLNLGHQPD